MRVIPTKENEHPLGGIKFKMHINCLILKILNMEKKYSLIKERRIVEKWSIDGKFIREYSSLELAGKEHNIDAVGITNCCRKRQKTAGGFVWKYKKNNT